MAALTDERRLQAAGQLEKLEKLVADPAALAKSCEDVIAARDTDKSGTLDSVTEIMGLLKSIYGLMLQKHDVTEDEAKATLEELDNNHDGALTADEIAPAITRALQKRISDLQAKLAQ